MTARAITRPTLAVYWTSGCGGCEAAFLDLGERLLTLERDFELVFFPLLIDRKREVLEGATDGGIDLSLLTGALRTVDDVRMARLLRARSKTLVAFGSCAQHGSVLALANLVPVETLLRAVCGEEFTAALVRDDTPLAPGEVAPTLAALTDSVEPVSAVVPVEYSVPGCPPEVDRLGEVLEMFAAGLGQQDKLPPAGTVLGGSAATVCEDCARKKPEKRVPQFSRLHEVDPDRDRCLLDEGLVCSGPATRGGCGAPCPAAGAPCRGCYGHPLGIDDQGARMVGALAAIVEMESSDADPELLRQRTEEILSSVVDPVGTLYRYCFAQSLLACLREPGGGPT